MTKVKWGILSTSNHGIKRVIPAIKKCSNAEIVAIASGNIIKARDTASQFDIPIVFNSYEELLSSPEVDVIYNPLPNHLHLPFTVKALENNKHVLCEKPIGLNLNEARQLLCISRKFPNLKVMEAFMYRFHPQWKLVKQIINDGRIGLLTTVNSFFSYNKLDPENVRNRADMGGGALLDIGCYCISLSRFLFNDEPLRVVASMKYDSQFGVDKLVSGIMEFEKGNATFSCGTQIEASQKVTIFGTCGFITIEIPFNAPIDKECKIIVSNDSTEEIINIGICDQYTIQAEMFSQAVLDDLEVPTSLEDAVNNMKVIDSIIESAKKGTWIS